jgi:ring-1,2-phenylacetyl-CoA epoxidase subunit PaaA
MHMATALSEVRTAPARIYPPRHFDERSVLPADYRAAVIRLITETGEIGSTEAHRRLMRRMATWVDLAPTLGDRVRTAEFYADEMRHGYIFEMLLRALGVEPDESSNTSIEGLHLLHDVDSWEQFVVLTTVADRAASFQFGDYRNSSYAPLAHISASMTKDEQGHATTGLLHLRELVRTPRGRAAAQVQLDRWWPIALDMFGTSDGERQFQYIAWGLRERTNEELRQAYIAHARPLLEQAGLVVPDDRLNRNFL